MGLLQFYQVGAISSTARSSNPSDWSTANRQSKIRCVCGKGLNGSRGIGSTWLDAVADVIGSVDQLLPDPSARKSNMAVSALVGAGSLAAPRRRVHRRLPKDTSTPI